MLILNFPWVFVLLPLPWLMPKLFKPIAAQRPSVHVPFLMRVSLAMGVKPSTGAVVLDGGPFQKIMMWVVWVNALLAMSGPTWVLEPIVETHSQRDIMLAVDISGSMETEDFFNPNGEAVSRMEAAKKVLGEFIDRREGDRLGLIVFGTAAFLQAPFMNDSQVVGRLLKESDVFMAGPKTAMGDAMGLAVNRFKTSDMPEKILIVLTDGNDTASQLDPVKAAKAAAEEGVTVYTVGLGDPTSVGEAPLDETVLKAVAESGQGDYARANTSEELKAIYSVIDQSIGVEQDTVTHHPTRDLSFLPLCLINVVGVLWFLSRLTVGDHRLRVRA